MGAVWLAQDTSLDTPCAIKFIHGEAAESVQMRSRFEREAKSAAQLRSPNVVQILDHGISDGTPYIAMEFLEGEDLAQRLKRTGRLGAHQTVSILSQVAKALTKATAAGLVHRDLKPANIFLVRDEDQDLAKVLDFGVAKSSLPDFGNPDTSTGSLVGTPFYMSPEQARGLKTIDYRSDLWALAVIVFECLTGRRPFVGDSLGNVLFKIGVDPIPMPSSVAPDLPPSLDAWWERAARRDPAQRFQTARELIDALTLALDLAPSVSANAFPSGIAMSPPHAPQPSWPEVPLLKSISADGADLLPTLVLPLSDQSGISAHSIAEKPEPRRGKAGLLVALAGAVIVAGGLVYVLAFRAVSPPTASSTTTPAEHPQPAAAVPGASELPVPVPLPVVTALPAPPTSASASILARVPPLATSRPDAGAKAVHTGKAAAAAPRGAPVPEDGI
ncbi:MAG: serine/threonine-protein kinase [Byssovorax sp.]